MSLAELNAQQPLDDVFFDFDKADLSDRRAREPAEERGLDAKWPSTKVTVEGHADSRGTNEYNLALGERRASSVRDYLVEPGRRRGARERREQGRGSSRSAREDTEACWAQNRRGHFVITAK